jgi:predicted amidohydrolase YtcJ
MSTTKGPNAPFLFTNGKIFNASRHSDEPTFHDWMLIEDGLVKEIGSNSDAMLKEIKASAPTVQDLSQKTVLPGFIDGHMHLLMLGQSLQKLNLWGCETFDDIRSRIKEYAAKNPDMPRILCRGWMNFMTNGEAQASMLDDLDERPIFIDSRDLHSVWCNSAGLKDMEVDTMVVPRGGLVERDENGKPSGLVGEASVLTHVWPHLARVASMEEKTGAIKAAIDLYTEAGYTGVVDMAMDANAWEAILTLIKNEPGLAMRISAYYFIAPTENVEDAVAQVKKAIEMTKEFNNDTSPNARILGLKVILDGVIDACRAAVSQPYSSNGDLPDALWKPEILGPVVKMADEAGIQCAIHAIGDAAITMAINAIENNCSPGKRHRIEHLELSSPEDAKRLGKLGITASIQPVHSDPAILRAWPSILGEERLKRAFAYRDFHDHGAPLAIGTDSPTAPHAPFANLYVATTRKSAKEPARNDQPVNPNFVLGIYHAIAGATAGVAYSTFSESRVGSLKPGQQADFVVVDLNYDNPETLVGTHVQQTWFGGRRVFGS